MWTYNATVVRVIDGDTVDLIIDLGFSVSFRERVRLLGIDTPELTSSDPVKRTAAQAAKMRLTQMLPEGSRVIVVTQKDQREKYGRYLATITTDTYASVAETLIAEGFGTAYYGGKR